MGDREPATRKINLLLLTATAGLLVALLGCRARLLLFIRLRFVGLVGHGRLLKKSVEKKNSN